MIHTKYVSSFIHSININTNINYRQKIKLQLNADLIPNLINTFKIA